MEADAVPLEVVIGQSTRSTSLRQPRPPGHYDPRPPEQHDPRPPMASPPPGAYSPNPVSPYRSSKPRRNTQSELKNEGYMQQDAADVEEEEEHKVVVVYFFTFVQLIVGILQLTGTPNLPGDIAPWGLSVYTENLKLPLLNGTVDASIKRVMNPYYGPSTELIVQWGAKYAPCMRETSVSEKYDSIALVESTKFGCCTLFNPVTNALECGLMNSTECYWQGATFALGQSCNSTCNTVLRPCCFGVDYQCTVQRKEYCDGLKGFWHEDKTKCSEVNCLNDVCGLGANANLGKAPNQPERFFIPIWLHAGLIHLLLNLLIQVPLGQEIEKRAGWWRFILMYIGSGIGGNLFAAVFVPDQISLGASSAIYGLFGVDLVHMFHRWKLIQNKCTTLFCSMLSTALYLGIGTLPWIDNWAHFGGFFFGALLGNVFLPFYEFSGVKRKCGFALSLVLICFSLIILATWFYENQDPEFCSWCKYVSCIPYTDGLCDQDTTA